MDTERRFDAAGEEFEELNDYLDNLEARERRHLRRVREESLAGASLICGLFAGLVVHLIITAIIKFKTK